MWRSFPYSKRPFIMTLLSLGLLLLALAYLLVMISSDVLTPLLVLIIGVACTVILGISPLLTDHEMDDGFLVLRQGWYFRARVPLMEVGKVSCIPRGPARTGVYFSLRSSTLYVTTRRNDLIEVQLRSGRRFPWAWGKRADHVIFDAIDTGALMRAIEEGSSLSPVQSDGPHT